MVGKLIAFFYGLPGLKKSPSYLLERMGLKNRRFDPIGLSIALAKGLPVLIRLSTGKE
jgi:hypothetical protein